MAFNFAELFSSYPQTHATSMCLIRLFFDCNESLPEKKYGVKSDKSFSSFTKLLATLRSKTTTAQYETSPLQPKKVETYKSKYTGRENKANSEEGTRFARGSV